MEYHLAQVNIARMRGGPGDAVVEGLVARIEEMNRLAEESPGFVWRLPGAEATPEALEAFATSLNPMSDHLPPLDSKQLFYNLSVWKTVDDLRRYVYRSRHAEMVRDRHSWIEPLAFASLALWWIPTGALPSIDASATRLKMVRLLGATPFAFTLERTFPPPVDMLPTPRRRSMPKKDEWEILFRRGQAGDMPPTPRRRSMPKKDEREILFRRGQEAFAGRTFPVGKPEEKLLRLLLSGAAGCDVTITARELQAQHGTHWRPTEYFVEPMPGMLSQLLRWSGVTLPTTEVRALLDPSKPESRLPDWLTEPRLLWMEAKPDVIRIAIRSGAGEETTALDHWPEPLPVRAPGQRVYRDLAEALVCPHCGANSRHYRELFDKSLVCGACHRSFMMEFRHG